MLRLSFFPVRAWCALVALSFTLLATASYGMGMMVRIYDIGELILVTQQPPLGPEQQVGQGLESDPGGVHATINWNALQDGQSVFRIYEPGHVGEADFLSDMLILSYVKDANTVDLTFLSDPPNHAFPTPPSTAQISDSEEAQGIMTFQNPNDLGLLTVEVHSTVPDAGASWVLLGVGLAATAATVRRFQSQAKPRAG